MEIEYGFIRNWWENLKLDGEGNVLRGLIKGFDNEQKNGGVLIMKMWFLKIWKIFLKMIFWLNG